MKTKTRKSLSAFIVGLICLAVTLVLNVFVLDVHFVALMLMPVFGVVCIIMSVLNYFNYLPQDPKPV